MPLSDEEMRLLEQMERALVEEDPKFASTLRGTRFGRATRVRIVAAAAAFVVGIALLMTGAVMGSRIGIAVGIAGFVVMLASATVGLGAWRGRQHDHGSASSAPSEIDPSVGLSVIQGGRRDRSTKRARTERGRQSKSSGTFMERMEERWRRRRDQRNGF